MSKIKKRKKESELIRFVWSRREEYDIAVLQETQARNPFSCKNQKPIWDDIAKTLQEGELKMKVTDRSCRERVAELLKKYRKDEAVIIQSTGATDDTDSEIKQLLEIVNEMANTKPAPKESIIYSKKKKSEGEKIRDAVLNEVSDSDSDEYITERNPRKRKVTKSRDNEEMEYITDVNGFFNDQMSLEEEERMYRGSRDESEAELEQDIPSTSRYDIQSIPVTIIPLATLSSQSEESNLSEVVSPLDLPSQSSFSQPVVQQTTTASVIHQTTTATGIQQSTTSLIHRKSTALESVTSNPSQELNSNKNNRLSNPKKDLVSFLERKAEIEWELRKEEIRLRELEVANKTEELKILRLKTQAEADEKKKAAELEAENKKEELSILRLKTEAEAEERRKTQELLISLLTKKD